MNLARFKTEICLPDFAGQSGWMIDRAGGVGRAVQMRKTDGSAEVVISRKNDRWIYFRRDKSSSGSIIDFCQKELGLDWHNTIKTLAETLRVPPPQAQQSSFPTARKKRPQTSTVFQRATDYRAYLETRGIAAATIAAFWDSINSGPGGAVQFPHTEAGGSGHEYRGPRSRGFSPGGIKTFWLHRPAEASALVVCESGIDCLSYAQAHGLPRAAYASTGGACGPDVVNELVRLAKTMKHILIAATDADEAGDRLASQLEKAAADLDVVFRRDRPRAKDWNDDLLEK